MGKHNKITTPPYLSVKKIVEMVDLISSRNYPEGITPEFFRDRGFSPTDAMLAVNTLKFLNLLNDDGSPTDSMGKTRLKGEALRPEFEKIIRSGYKKLFDTVENPYMLDKEQLANEFLAVYKLSDRILSAAIPAFYKLGEYAGLKEEKAISRVVTPRPRNPGNVSRQGTKKSQVGASGGSIPSGFSDLPIANGTIIIRLSEAWKNRLLEDEKLEGKWHTARAALKNLADSLRGGSTPGQGADT